MTTKQEQTAATTARLLQVAREEFTLRGYADVALEDVVAAAGVTRGALYHHFGSKVGLFRAVFDEVQGLVSDAIIEATADEVDAWHELVVGCRTYLHVCARPSVHRILLIDGPAVLGWSYWRSVDGEQSARLLDEVLRRIESQRVIPRGSARAAASLISGALNEAVLWIADSADRDRDLAAAQRVLRRLLDGLRS